jgi:hypothetical protein
LELLALHKKEEEEGDAIAFFFFFSCNTKKKKKQMLFVELHYNAAYLVQRISTNKQTK